MGDNNSAHSDIMDTSLNGTAASGANSDGKQQLSGFGLVAPSEPNGITDTPTNRTNQESDEESDEDDLNTSTYGWESRNLGADGPTRTRSKRRREDGSPVEASEQVEELLYPSPDFDPISAALHTALPRHTEVKPVSSNLDWISRAFTNLELDTNAQDVHLYHTIIEDILNRLEEKSKLETPPSLGELDKYERLITLGTSRLPCSMEVQIEHWRKTVQEFCNWLGSCAEIAADGLNAINNHRKRWLLKADQEANIRTMFVEVRELGSVLSFVMHYALNRISQADETAATAFRNEATEENRVTNIEQQIYGDKERAFLTKLNTEVNSTLHLCGEVEGRLAYQWTNNTRHRSKRAHERNSAERAQDRQRIAELERDQKLTKDDLAVVQKVLCKQGLLKLNQQKPQSTAPPAGQLSKVMPAPPTAPFQEATDRLFGLAISCPFHFYNITEPFPFKRTIKCNDGVVRPINIMASCVQHAHDTCLALWLGKQDWVETFTKRNLKNTIEHMRQFVSDLAAVEFIINQDTVDTWSNEFQADVYASAFEQRIKGSSNLQVMIACLGGKHCHFVHEHKTLGTGVNPAESKSICRKDYEGRNLLGKMLDDSITEYSPSIEHDLFKDKNAEVIKFGHLHSETLWKPPSVTDPQLRQTEIMEKLDLKWSLHSKNSDSDVKVAVAKDRLQLYKIQRNRADARAMLAKQTEAQVEPAPSAMVRPTLPFPGNQWRPQTPLQTMGPNSTWPLPGEQPPAVKRTPPQSRSFRAPPAPLLACPVVLPAATSSASQSRDASMNGEEAPKTTPIMLQTIRALMPSQPASQQGAIRQPVLINREPAQVQYNSNGRGRGGRGRGGRGAQAQRQQQQQGADIAAPYIRTLSTKRPEVALLDKLEEYIIKHKKDFIKVGEFQYFQKNCFDFALPFYNPDPSKNEPLRGRQYPADDLTLLNMIPKDQRIDIPFTPFGPHIDYINPDAFRDQLPQDAVKLWAGQITQTRSYYMCMTGDNSAAKFGRNIQRQAYADSTNEWPSLDGYSCVCSGTSSMRVYDGRYVWPLIPQPHEKIIVLMSKFDWIDLYEMSLRRDLYTDADVDAAIDKMTIEYFAILREIRRRCPNSIIIWVFGSPVVSNVCRESGDTGEEFNNRVQERIATCRADPDLDMDSVNFQIYDVFALFCHYLRNTRNQNKKFHLNIAMRSLVNGCFLSNAGRVLLSQELLRFAYHLLIVEENPLPVQEEVYLDM